MSLQGAFVVVVTLLAVSACDEPCCASNDDCNDGLRCFDNRCAVVCVDDDECNVGDRCVDAGVCRADVVVDDDTCSSVAGER